MSAEKTKRRFIAGAVCPRCATMDTIQTYRWGDYQCRECVDCGFFEELHVDHGGGPELPTRVNRPVVEAQQKQADEVQVVKIMDGKPGKDRGER